MIHMDNVSYSFQKGAGVENINLELADGEFVYLIGPTGSGKTTLLRLIYMDLLPQVGSLQVNKFNSLKIKKRKIPFLRRTIGMVFQDYNLLNDRNLFENVALPLHVTGFAREEIEDRVNDALGMVGLEGKESYNPRELSGGEQQRACVARAIVKEPDIILADEPTGNLDPLTAFELIKLFEEINREGTTVLMASHNYNIIKGRGRRIIEIQDGKLRQ
ncbi:MAG: ATP-binding cassette domain-containing protein [Candidatus Neomarinimicrobiota bacterium]